MIDITDSKEPCFAMERYGCIVYGVKECYPRCAFYKPVDCEDWIRREVGDRVYLYEPEEWEDLKR